MDINAVPVSKIVEIGRLAAALPDVDYLLFGESDYPSPASARDALVAALDGGATTYPDVRGIPPLQEALASYLTGLHDWPVEDDRIQITASGMAAVSIALAATVKPGQRVLLHSPAWPNLGNAALSRGAQVAELELTGLPDGRFRLDLQHLDAALEGCRAFILNSPNNPTGWTATYDELQGILNLCRQHGVWLISDEVYSRLVYDGRAAAPSLLDIAEPEDRVLVCNSFSKGWAMAGWRLGWIVTPAGLRDRIADIVEVTHSGVASYTQYGGVAALGDTPFMQEFQAYCAQGRALVSEMLKGLNGIRYTAPDGAFYAFVGAEGLTDSLAVARHLVTKNKVAVAPGIAFGESGEGFLRICFAQRRDRLERAMGRLRAGLKEVLA
ncbi:MAG: aminotransferase class I/II-fold pyridoxal phosphate-dependent enzyme [Acetobacteraceae bacterium]|nr:aminotransferase class I/II-fold pyridoxal phosphate-dependent enzyme [Acetobacteraceae bacterium]MBV8522593.1 aminotransferase class I/II-fold pyridoxal phosphate-dependent enzyme [Acetobacteraceae bacterium]